MEIAGFPVWVLGQEMGELFLNGASHAVGAGVGLRAGSVEE